MSTCGYKQSKMHEEGGRGEVAGDGGRARLAEAHAALPTFLPPQSPQGPAPRESRDRRLTLERTQGEDEWAQLKMGVRAAGLGNGRRTPSPRPRPHTLSLGEGAANRWMQTPVGALTPLGNRGA